MRTLVSLLILLTAWALAPGQSTPAMPVLGLHFCAGVQLPGGELAERFGLNANIGLGIDVLTSKNWIAGLEGSFLFGQDVREDVLTPLRTPEGLLVSDSRVLADVLLRERGFYAGAMVGKLFPVFSSGARSGIRVTAGGGLLQHKIRLQDDPDAPTASLTTEYKKGYDHLSNGPAISGFVGYQHLSRDRLVNFIAGMEVVHGFTQSRRSFNFDTRSAYTARRSDTLFGLRIGLTLPFYFGDTGEEFLY